MILSELVRAKRTVLKLGTCAFNEGIKTGEEKGREIYVMVWYDKDAFFYRPDSAMSASREYIKDNLIYKRKCKHSISRVLVDRDRAMTSLKLLGGDQ